MEPTPRLSFKMLKEAESGDKQPYWSSSEATYHAQANLPVY